MTKRPQQQLRQLPTVQSKSVNRENRLIGTDFTDKFGTKVHKCTETQSDNRDNRLIGTKSAGK